MGDKGLEYINTQTPDLVVINVVLAEKMEGIQMARIIQNFHPIPFIFIHTQRPSREQKRELRDISQYFWLNKPFEVEKLQSAIDILIFSSNQWQG